ncbi:MAG TPA: superoxide dismutase family protein [Acidisarcina sp.]|nr:superoxide dismutase family protein [Acidisarcina sp.]
MKFRPLLAVAAAAFVLLPAALQADPAAPATAAPVTVKMKTADGKDAGTITLTEKKGGVTFTLDLMNLPPGDHAIHVHQFPKCDPPTFATSGFHFNPSGKQHGIKNPAGSHEGDIPLSLKVKADGTEKSSFVVKTLSLEPSAANSVFANGGTSIVIHEGVDDMMTDPGGNSGARIACGVIAPPGA